MAVGATPTEVASLSRYRVRATYHVSARCNGGNWGKFLVDSGASASLIGRRFVPESVPIRSADDAISLHVLTGHEIDIFGIAVITLDFGHIQKKQNFIVCEDEMFSSRMGILGLDFLEDNNALINVKDKCMQLDGQWVELSPRARDPSVLYVVRNKKSCRKLQRENDVDFPGNGQDPDQIFSVPPTRSTTCPCVKPREATSTKPPAIEESIEPEETSSTLIPPASPSPLEKQIQLMLSSFEEILLRLGEYTSSLDTATSNVLGSSGKPQKEWKQCQPKTKKRSSPTGSVPSEPANVSPLDNAPLDTLLVNNETPSEAPRSHRPEVNETANEGVIADSCKVAPLDTLSVNNETPFEFPRSHRPEVNETANESVIAGLCKIAPHDVKLDRKSFDDPNKAFPAPGDVPSRDAVPEPADAKTHKSAFATPVTIPKRNGKLSFDNRIKCIQDEFVAPYSEKTVRIHPSDNCGPDTIVVPTEFRDSVLSIECSPQSETDSNKPPFIVRNHSAHPVTIRRGTVIANLQPTEDDDPEQLSYFDFTAPILAPLGAQRRYEILPRNRRKRSAGDPALSEERIRIPLSKDCKSNVIVTPTEYDHSVLSVESRPNIDSSNHTAELINQPAQSTPNEDRRPLNIFRCNGTNNSKQCSYFEPTAHDELHPYPPPLLPHSTYL